MVSSQLNEAETETAPGDQLREKTRKWLSPPDPSTNHNTACEARHDGTATWFLEGITYNEWKATGSLLWTHGNRTAFHGFPPTSLTICFVAGSGKSILWWVSQINIYPRSSHW